MTYDEMVEGVAEISGHSIETVKDILFAVPDVLLDMDEGEKTHTPLGVFYMFKSKSRTVIMPNRKDTVLSRPFFSVKLKSSVNMKRPD